MASVSRIPEGLISKTAIFESETPMTKIIPAIREFDAVIINKGGKYSGIIDSRTLYKTQQSTKFVKSKAAANLVINVPRITDTTSIDDAVYYFNKSRVKALPYMINNKIKGVLKRATLIKMLLSLDRLDGIKVSEAMASPLIAIDSNATIAQAKAAMRENKINRLAVYSNGGFIGIVSNYDMMERVIKPTERLPEMQKKIFTPANVKLADLVERTPVTIEQNKSLREAAQKIIENRVSSLIVAKNSKPVGVLTELDIIEIVMARASAEPERIFISGLDADTYEYEDAVRESLMAFMAKVERMSKVRPDYMTLVVKHFKTKSYELYARVSLGGNGIINAHVTGHIFERTVTDILDILYNKIKETKERYIGVRKVMGNAHEDVLQEE